MKTVQLFFRKIQELLRQRQEHKIILGDFNLVLDVELDRLNTYANNSKAQEVVLDTMDEFCLQDTWRIRNASSRQYSWIKRNCFGSETTKASRIDFVLASKGIDQNIEMISYLSAHKTDHRAIYLVIDLCGFERGIGYWKLNTQLLEDKSYVDLINQEIEHTLSLTEGRSPGDRWEILKTRIKKQTIEFSKGRVSELNLIISSLAETVNEYEERLPLGEQDNELYIATKEDLESKVFEKTKGIMFRSKARWYEEGEKNTKYFYSLEKAKYNAKTCYKIITDEGLEVFEPQQILLEQKNFYDQLYQEDADVHFDMANTFNIHVPDYIVKEQDKEITILEIEHAIKGMKNGKTPGQDGLSIEFYKSFGLKIKTLFMELVKHCYEEGRLFSSARKGILNLIPKANKDSRFIKNLRPITLLNSDYKVIEKVIANKMIPALETIIHTDQRGFMRNRRISVNIRKMLDIIHEAEKEDLEAVVLSLDFVKCFDKCSFKILHGSLAFFGFGECVTRWTQILYKDFTVKIQNNGYFSAPVEIKKGVHQGGCCSSIYFLVIAELLALALRSNQDIEGITLRDIRNLLNQFADDMDIFSMAQEKSLQNIFLELDKFRLQSGFTVSYDKTTLYRIGSLRHSDASMYDISQVKWSNQDITVLGVTISHERSCK